MAVKKRGRPRKLVESEEQGIIREWWRKARARYYERNREKVLQKARKELPCWGCPGLVEWEPPSTRIVYTRDKRYLCEYKQMFVDPNEKKKCDREPVCIEEVV